MQFLFDKLEGYRSLILGWLSFFGLYSDMVRDIISQFTSLFGMPLDSTAAVGAFLAAALITIKTVIDIWRKARA